MSNIVAGVFCLLALLLPRAHGFAQTTANKTLIVGAKDTVPFAMNSEDGARYGISIELWRQSAEPG